MKAKMSEIIFDILAFLRATLLRFLQRDRGFEMGKLERLRAQREKKEEIARKARAEASDIAKREKTEEARLAKLDRSVATRRETQLLCTLGRAFMSLHSHSGQNASMMQRYLNGYISRDIDRDILRGTPYEVPEPSQYAEEPVYAQHEPTHHE